MAVKAYIVTDGDYSDYHIVGVYSTEEQAEQARLNFNADSVETWELDSDICDHGGLLRYDVVMDRDGNTTSISRESNRDKPSRDWQPYGRRHKGEEYLMFFPVWANNEEHAVKIANERRAQLVASGQWGIEWEDWRKKVKNGEL